MRAVAADRARFGLDDGVGDAAAVEDPAIRLIHGVVAGAELVDVGVEAVGVFHQKLAGPQDPEPRAGFVAEFGLDLVKRDRQLLVRPDQVADEVGTNFLVGRPEGEVLLRACRELHEQFAERLIPPRLFPEFHRLERGHEQLERPGGVHLLSDDPDDLVQDPEAEREVGVRPSAKLPDHPRPEQELVARRDGVGRGFLQGRYQGFRPAQESAPAPKANKDARAGRPNPIVAPIAKGIAGHLTKKRRPSGVPTSGIASIGCASGFWHSVG